MKRGLSTLRWVSGVARAPVRVALRRASRGPRRATWEFRTELTREIVAQTLRAMIDVGPDWGRRLQRRRGAMIRSKRVEFSELGFGRGGVVARHRSRPDDGPVVFFTHGGGYVIGDPEMYRGVMAKLISSGGVAYAPRMALAPEHPYPSCLEEAEAAYRWVAERVDPSRLVVAGDSAGGGLALALCRRMLETGGPVPRAAFLMSPWVDPYFEGDIENYRSIDILDPRFTDYCRAQVATPERRDDPYLVPRADIHAELPPLLVHDGDADTLHTQIRRYVVDARSAGIDVEYETFPDMFHVFQIALGAVPEASDSLRRAARWLRERVEADDETDDETDEARPDRSSRPGRSRLANGAR